MTEYTATERVALAERLASVAERAENAARSAGRSFEELLIIPVTKFQPESLTRELYDLGVRDFAENRHQDARVKAAACADLPGIVWHFVGQLQSKKARQVRSYARVIHSVDRVSLAEALAYEHPLEPELATGCFIQVNLTLDSDRGGVADAEDVQAVAEAILAAPGLQLMGVMAVAPLDEEPRAAFARLRGISDRVRLVAPAATMISAGMTNDFEEAILEGATHLRIGSAITGNRPPNS
jgi:pyridoxal phosphate enzyme (YggS family)